MKAMPAWDALLVGQKTGEWSDDEEGTETKQTD